MVRTAPPGDPVSRTPTSSPSANGEPAAATVSSRRAGGRRSSTIADGDEAGLGREGARSGPALPPRTSAVRDRNMPEVVVHISWQGRTALTVKVVGKATLEGEGLWRLESPPLGQGENAPVLGPGWTP